MATSNRLAIVLAAGKGTRMESDLPKVLVEICGRPMIDFVLDALRKAGVNRVVVVVGYRSDDVRAHLKGYGDVTFVEQTEQLGTGHAVMVCRDELVDHNGPVVIVAGDSPLTQSSSIESLFVAFEKEKPACILGTTYADDPTGLGRIVRDDNGEFVGIVEQKDATPEQQAIREVNMSTYVFDCRQLLDVLAQLTTNNAQGEYYITDGPGILRSAGQTVLALPVLKPCETLSINNMAQLAVAEQELAKQLGGGAKP
ncbi:MAG: NTP transferase domain-containing protein [Planctomycetales bacterium]|nr:NTP transferase domain-containing protein [Planctomycetales bacterium]